MAALDVGEVRTGIAVSDPGRVLARPVEVVPSEDLLGALRRLVDEEGVDEVLVGVPRTLGGEVGFQARKVLARVDALQSELAGVRFVEWDERLSTRVAVAGARAGGKKKPRRGAGRGAGRDAGRGAGRVDHLAAARMLQEYLDSRGAPEAPRPR